MGGAHLAGACRAHHQCPELAHGFSDRYLQVACLLGLKSRFHWQLLEYTKGWGNWRSSSRIDMGLVIGQ